MQSLYILGLKLFCNFRICICFACLPNAWRPPKLAVRWGSIQFIHTLSSALVTARFLLNSVLCFQSSLLVRYFVSTHEQMHSCLQVQIFFYHATRHSLNLIRLYKCHWKWSHGLRLCCSEKNVEREILLECWMLKSMQEGVLGMKSGQEGRQAQRTAGRALVRE